MTNKNKKILRVFLLGPMIFFFTNSYAVDFDQDGIGRIDKIADSISLSEKRGNSNGHSKTSILSVRNTTQLIGGVAGGYACVFSLLALSDKNEETAIVGSFIAYPCGNAIGSYVVGKIWGEHGTFLGTLTGSVVGSLFGAITKNQTIYIVLPPIGATIGFNITRKHRVK